MTTEQIGVIVAAIAVLISAISQIVTIRFARFSLTSTIRANLFESETTKLREALGEYLPLTYFIDQGWRRYILDETAGWPGNLYDEVAREDVLFTKIRLMLDVRSGTGARILKLLEDLRDVRSDTLWIERRDAVIAGVIEELETTRNAIFKA
jgi:hypothetical protein